MRNMFKQTIYEVVSAKAGFIWGVDSLREAKEQLAYVRDVLGYDDAFINEYEREYVW